MVLIQYKDVKLVKFRSLGWQIGSPTASSLQAMTKQGVTNTLALPINKVLYIYLLCPHSEHQKTSAPIETVCTLSPKRPVLLM
jgi:hypothetical protein